MAIKPVACMLTAFLAAIIVISSFLEFYIYIIALMGFLCLLLLLKKI